MAPATILGLLATVVGPVLPPAADLLVWGAGWPTRWLVLVAESAAQLPDAAPGWPAGLLGATLLAGLLAGGGTGITVALFVAGCAAVSIITVLTARETKDVATDDLGGLRQRQVSAGAAVESVEVR